MIKLTLTLADGTQFSEIVRKIPKTWKSRLMGHAPYNTNFQGATFSIERKEGLGR